VEDAGPVRLRFPVPEDDIHILDQSMVPPEPPRPKIDDEAIIGFVLPPGWKVGRDDAGHTYFIDTVSDTISDELPEGSVPTRNKYEWKCVADEQGRLYYVNHKTGMRSWMRPLDFPGKVIGTRHDPNSVPQQVQKDEVYVSLEEVRLSKAGFDAADDGLYGIPNRYSRPMAYEQRMFVWSINLRRDNGVMCAAALTCARM
jgi:hypothetical protein